MKKWKLLSSLSVLGAAALVGLSACGSTANGDSEAGLGQINVVTREDGSGTRGAFIELFGLEEKNSDGEKVDLTTQNAIVTNSTSVMLTTVAEDGSAIGYASLGSLNDSVKVVDIDGAEATVENIKDGSYKVSRPFNIVTKDDTNEAAKDFINFILSSEGQAIVEKSGYIPLDDNGSYKSSVNSGKVVISGSSSVTPVMEKLKEAYAKVNPDVTIEIQQSDSSTGVANTIDGTADIGMASRELKDTEEKEGVTATVIAMDGIAVIVNDKNEVDDLTSEQVKDIFAGDTTSWEDLSE
ncbi:MULTISPECIES: substrate-binding domain-containing protein [Streptococcus]|uniref:substrate-binding domain-containing protein n=1 Tax=Streptococcus TaxID=1301 RepID=UPI00143F5352|nr:MULTISPECIES: substrate-binding domain-containing protein [Streptococcus]MBD9119254.1 extracellular solute-binding protein [Streptococcus sp.]MBM6698512.1 extracellular solute-binding protein [Streptococcus alactolyticus]NKN41483.1 extracellular solute-binding protein [Streptococcus alactolyticus]NKN84668.1 extracellular solute-binding protein [Streptococcus agalactiae]